LRGLIGAISRRDPKAHIIFLGDYINRGPDSRKVVDLLLSLPHATFLRGNHDDVFDLLLHGDCYICHPGARDAVAAFAWFMQHGLAETLISYGADPAELEQAMQQPTPEKVQKFVKPVPASHRRFFKSLKAVYETQDFFAAHGYWDPDAPDESPGLAARIDGDPTLRYRLLWGRFNDAQVRQPKRWHRIGFFGHTPVHNYPAGAELTPVFGPNIILLDTASALSSTGMLSALCVETGKIIQADRAGETDELPDPM
jgi:hypothetical protein